MSDSPNVFINALTSDSWTDIGRDAVVSYAISSGYGIGWTPELATAIVQALESFATVCGLTFLRVENDAEADIVEYRVTAAQFKAAFPDSLYGPYAPNWAGYHYSPVDVAAGGPARGYYDEAQIGSWLPLHELLHGIALEHPHSTIHGSGLFPGVPDRVSNDLGDFNLNNTLNTLMSFNVLPGYEAGDYDGPMAMDIAALQFLYGRNLNTAVGDDIYVAARNSFKGIWDAGGVDWLVAGSDAGSVLDLRPATLVLGFGAGGWLSKANDTSGGYTIAFGTDIENARGGAGTDTLVGNDLVNILEGGGGNDYYYTDDADDILFDTGGFDSLKSNVDATLTGRVGKSTRGSREQRGQRGRSARQSSTRPRA